MEIKEHDHSVDIGFDFDSRTNQNAPSAESQMRATGTQSWVTAVEWVWGKKDRLVKYLRKREHWEKIRDDCVCVWRTDAKKQQCVHENKLLKTNVKWNWNYCISLYTAESILTLKLCKNTLISFKEKVILCQTYWNVCVCVYMLVF